ncbi:hypothetical protein F4561_000622 [Lipingzhangella halophila]|uniref:Uncharacterized protein n=1 Tax=Lipingzhangella halophila TaxID=1783352 RepID=A0A7W7W0D6_9ACTN|nr:hypothetical protein [Lipingzhangella halophila]MBB4929802.1 hypothetical protein [Lipingzhangella halophila]
MNLGRLFALVGVLFGAVFVLVNAGGLPAPWDVAVRVAGVALTAAAAWFGIIRGSNNPQSWSGSPWVYWVAVGAEVVAIPAGAAVLTQVLDRPQLVVLWVVFVVGAHFLPARVFGIGRYAELGALLMLVAVVAAVVHAGAGVQWAPSAGAVLAGVALLVFAAIPALSRSTATERGLAPS